MGLLERNKPTRHFVVVDAAGGFEDDIAQEIERRRMFGAIEAFDVFARAALGEDADKLGRPFKADTIDDARIAAFRQAGGFEAAQAAVFALGADERTTFSEPEKYIHSTGTPR